MPPEERLQVDLAMLSGYLGVKQCGYSHLMHLADDIVSSSRFKDGSYGDLLYERLERGMLELEDIAKDARDEGKPTIAILAWKNASAMAETQARLLGIGVPRAGAKGSLHVHVGQVSRNDIQKLIADYQAAALPGPDEAEVVEVESESRGED